MRRAWRAILVMACVLSFARIAAADSLSLTDEERAWITEHPVVRIAVAPDWKPVEYIEEGHYLGLSSEYVHVLERTTGLRFEVVSGAIWGSVTNNLSATAGALLHATPKAFPTPAVRQKINSHGRTT